MADQPLILTPLTGRASSFAGGIVSGLLTTLSIPIHGSLDGVMAATLSSPYGFVGDGFGPVINVDYGMHGTITTPYPFTAWGTGVMVATHGGNYTLSATGFGESLGGVSALLPALTGGGTGFGTSIGRMEATHGGRYGFEASGTGHMVGTLSTRYSVFFVGLGDGGGGGHLNAMLPRLVGGGTGFGGSAGNLSVNLPALRVVPMGDLNATLPRLTLSASGSSEDTVEYEAYSMTLVPTEQGENCFTTRITAAPFDRIVRFGADYYGVGDDGLFKLGGDTFAGAAINADVITAETDFGSQQLKRAVALWLGGRVHEDMAVSVISSETETDSYKYTPETGEEAHSHRVVFGKGIRARYWAYHFQTSNGSDFTIDDMTPEVAPLRRTA